MNPNFDWASEPETITTIIVLRRKGLMYKDIAPAMSKVMRREVSPEIVKAVYNRYKHSERHQPFTDVYDINAQVHITTKEVKKEQTFMQKVISKLTKKRTA